MYLVSMTIEGLRPIDNLRIDFDPREAPGWHVVIGPNGSGKSTLVRALSVAMLSDRDMEASRVALDRWTRPGAARSCVRVAVCMCGDRPGRGKGARQSPAILEWTTHLRPDGMGGLVSQKEAGSDSERMPWNAERGRFSAAIGPLRRLSGGDKEHEALFLRRPRLGAHLSVLDDGVALVEAQRWLMEMHVEELEAARDLRTAFEGALAEIFSAYMRQRRDSTPGGGGRSSRTRSLPGDVLSALVRIERRINGRLTLGAVKVVPPAVVDGDDVRERNGRLLADADIEIDSLSRRIVRFINASGFLFDRIKIVEVRKDQIRVRTEDGCHLELGQLSDGYRSIIGLGFELLRLMLAEYGLDAFQHGLNERDGVIDLPGVVAIDEVEAHLHPPWQEEIGDWLRRCFPKVQFIVTTHSPIVCRPIADPQGTVRGSVWQLHAPTDPGSGTVGIERITGERLLRLVYGDILEAVGTDAFGTSVEQSDLASGKVVRLAELNRLEIHGRLAEGERAELAALRGIFSARPGALPG